MIPDKLQYFLGHFWNFQKFDQTWTLGPLKIGNVLYTYCLCQSRYLICLTFFEHTRTDVLKHKNKTKIATLVMETIWKYTFVCFTIGPLPECLEIKKAI